MKRNLFLKDYDAGHPIFQHFTRRNSVNYHGQKSMAKKRKITWDFTFYEWIDWWVNTGHFHERGVNNHEYQMCRYNDVGAYSSTNVYCDTGKNNKHSRANPNKKRVHKTNKGYNIVVIATHKNTGKQLKLKGRAELELAGFDGTAVSRCCNGKRDSHKGYTFKYEN